ncbi:hypothetical protein E2C01_101917 [Portunus trituberculatus]|uniref:Uncharacterized protein n=1 Tax=Portunus trituberculatus TaxID=210409 RepID=A0A5B7KH77_PORTR|nr:hypothetical protein [Portunus trituberculatus]
MRGLKRTVNPFNNKTLVYFEFWIRLDDFVYIGKGLA